MKKETIKDIFTISGIKTSARNDGDVDLTVTLKTQIGPALVQEAIASLMPLHNREVNVSFDLRQMEIGGAK